MPKTTQLFPMKTEEEDDDEEDEEEGCSGIVCRLIRSKKERNKTKTTSKSNFFKSKYNSSRYSNPSFEQVFSLFK